MYFLAVDGDPNGPEEDFNIIEAKGFSTLPAALKWVDENVATRTGEPGTMVWRTLTKGDDIVQMELDLVKNVPSGEPYQILMDKAQYVTITNDLAD